jgi:hypothetical protein
VSRVGNVIGSSVVVVVVEVVVVVVVVVVVSLSSSPSRGSSGRSIPASPNGDAGALTTSAITRHRVAPRIVAPREPMSGSSASDPSDLKDQPPGAD